MPSNFVILSQRHHLIPLAWRLRHEGNHVQLIVLKPRYHRAWGHRFEQVLDRKIQWSRLAEERESLRAATQEANAIVVSDVAGAGWPETFAGSLDYWGPGPHHDTATVPASLGAWFNGVSFESPHLLLQDLGLWPGGLGSAIPGAATLIHIGALPEKLEALLLAQADALKSASFRGLVRCGLTNQQGSITIESMATGWSLLHSHAFMASQANMTSLLTGGQAVPVGKRFTIVAPVSLPPWPVESNVKPDPQPVLAQLQQSKPDVAAVVRGHVYWHDIEVDDGALRTAGVDGLVGVVHFSSNNLTLTRRRVVEYAALLGLKEAQYRVDLAADVDLVLGGFEAVGLEV